MSHLWSPALGAARSPGATYRGRGYRPSSTPKVRQNSATSIQSDGSRTAAEKYLWRNGRVGGNLAASASKKLAVGRGGSRPAWEAVRSDPRLRSGIQGGRRAPVTRMLRSSRQYSARRNTNSGSRCAICAASSVMARRVASFTS